MIGSNEITKEVDRLYREYSGKLVTSLVSFFKLNNLQLAEDIVQETFVASLNTWAEKGLPKDPVAWLFKVCKNKALNELNRKHNKDTTSFYQESAGSCTELNQAFLPSEIRNNQLRLLFATCHPDFPPRARIMLTLKTLAGFKVEEIAKGLSMNKEAIKKSLTRTRKQIKERNMPLKVPFVLQSKERLTSVHQVLYLIFNEGYKASFGDQLIRKDLCLQAMHLSRAILDEERVGNVDTHALFALMLFNVSRFETRVSASGEPIELEQQDRNLWDRDLIHQGIKHFNLSKRNASQWSNYHFVAAIASLHCTAATFEETNWIAILKLYDRLMEINNSPFLQLNRNIALFYSGKYREAMENITTIKVLNDDHIYYATMAKMKQHLGQKKEAINYYLDAINLARLDAEKRFLKKKIHELQS